jgi:acyl-coenzyme A synthetase/AMP-(fatty) acid ligase/acyl carrier protein
VILVGGEAIDSETWNALARSTVISTYNVYGPTECTVDSTVAGLQGDATEPHIGHPMKNRRIYILDQHLQPVPIGVGGELYIGGAGIARGYLNRPELTRERFLPDPFSAKRDARMYKTGDLGRWRADGNIEFLGRNDHQVKIRGYRIELGEIESQLARHVQVKEAVVLAREDVPGEQRLVAYVVAESAAETPSVEELRAHLKGALPDFMTPSAFVALDRLPLTPNGKLDRRALPEPEFGAYASRVYEAAQGEVEEILSLIWRELLRVERVGRQDNFFELGGHSLRAMKLVAQVAERLDVKISVIEIFKHPTLHQLASVIESHKRPELPASSQDEPELERGVI